MDQLKRITVSISDMKVSDDPGAFIITHSLGSCVGVIAYDARAQVGGLLHFQLPDSHTHGLRAQENPCMFADTGIPLLLSRLYELGAHKNRLHVAVFGGASMLDDEHLFKIGIKNARATKKILWQEALTVHYEDVGGHSSRTVSLEVGSGRIALRKDGRLEHINHH